MRHAPRFGLYLLMQATNDRLAHCPLMGMCKAGLVTVSLCKSPHLHWQRLIVRPPLEYDEMTRHESVS